MAMQWQYRTFVVGFQKNGLFGEKYIDEQETEDVLNEEAADGWELITASMVPDGLMLFYKRSVQEGQQPRNHVDNKPVIAGPRLFGGSTGTEQTSRKGDEVERGPTVENIKIL